MDPIFGLLLLVPLLLGKRKKGRSSRFNLEVYPPGSAEQIELFEAAAVHLGVPKSWARSYSLQKLLTKESNGGWVGIPNFEFGEDIAKPENRDQWPAIWNHLRAGGDPPKGRGATGIGQLILVTVDSHYPDGRAGIGDPWNEAVGMLSYINARWKSPDRALECYASGSCLDGVGIYTPGGKFWNGY